MKLDIIYSIEALPIIKSFIAECAHYHGAESKEAMNIELAAEEAAVHIIENHPDNSDDIFEISVIPLPEKESVRITLSNKGLPVDINNLPSYSSEKPEETLEGLNFFLIEHFTDYFHMENLGADGWLTVLEKKLKNFRGGITETKTEEKKDLPSRTREKFSIVMAVPEDAYEITKLAYFTYKYTYSKTVFYYPEILKENIQNGTVISFAAKIEDGTIVAHSAYIRSPYCREIVEAAALMSHPDYRHSMAGMRLLKTQHRFPAEENSGITVVESNLVTSHTGSQRVTKSMHFAPMAFKLSVHDHAKFVDINAGGDINPRETLLYSVWAPRGLPKPFTVHVPEKHTEIVRRLFEYRNFPATVSTAVQEFPADDGNFDLTKKEDLSLAEIHVNHIAGNWRENLKNFRKILSVEGIATIHLQIPADKPLPPDMDEKLQQSGFFFSGIVAETLEKWMLVYTFFNNQRFDFDKIALVDNMACELRNYVKERCAEIDI